MDFEIRGGSTPPKRQRVVDRPDRVEVLLVDLERQITGRAA
jgi:hypothetical protein